MTADVQKLSDFRTASVAREIAQDIKDQAASRLGNPVPEVDKLTLARIVVRLAITWGIDMALLAAVASELAGI